MHMVRIGTAALNQTPLAFEGNRKRIVDVVQAASKKEVDLLVLPELAVTGYGCEDQFLSLHTMRQSWESLKAIVPHIENMIVLVGLPVCFEGSVFNCVAVIQNKQIIGINAKKALPREGVHYEYRWFKPWPGGVTTELPVDGTKIPFGDLRYRFGEIGLAIEICEEAWGAESGAASHAPAVDIVANCSASHFATGKHKKRRTLVEDSSRALQVVYAYSNLLGNEAGRLIYDGGCMVACDGNMVAENDRFSFEPYTLLVSDVDLEVIKNQKLRSESVKDSRNKTFGQEVAGIPITTREKASVTSKQIDHVPLDANHEFLYAACLGLFDYLRKTKSKGFVVSLSGGCDSSTCAVLVAQTLELARHNLGEKLPQTLGMDHTPSAKDFLTCVYQATEHSSKQTEAAATALAEALEATFIRISLSDAVKQYVELYESSFNRKLDWQNDDIVLQNVQARLRAPFPWMVANANSSILLTTSNRSEGSVGYATMDGDMAGGLAPIAGVDKKFLQRWLGWMETECKVGIGNISCLNLVNEQQPTAELRPSEAGQFDEQDLMPYEVLDRIEELYLRDKISPTAITTYLKKEFPAYQPEQLTEWCDKFIGLWKRSQWKRERLAPGFHLDDYSLDPKGWLRNPILSE